MPEDIILDQITMDENFATSVARVREHIRGLQWNQLTHPETVHANYRVPVLLPDQTDGAGNLIYLTLNTNRLNSNYQPNLHSGLSAYLYIIQIRDAAGNLLFDAPNMYAIAPDKFTLNYQGNFPVRTPSFDLNYNDIVNRLLLTTGDRVDRTSNIVDNLAQNIMESIRFPSIADAVQTAITGYTAINFEEQYARITSWSSRSENYAREMYTGAIPSTDLPETGMLLSLSALLTIMQQSLPGNNLNKRSSSDEVSDIFEVLISDGIGLERIFQNDIATSIPSGWCIGGASKSITLADFNGDGKKDLICDDSSTGRHSVILSTGVGFRSAVCGDNNGLLSAVACSTTGATTSWVDFDGDGKADLVCNNGIGASSNVGSHYVMLSTGAGLVSPNADPNGLVKNAWCFGTGQKASWVDFNGDGKADLVCRDASTTSTAGNIWVGL